MNHIIKILMLSIFALSTLQANTVANKAYQKAESLSKKIKNSSNKKELYSKATGQYKVACENGNKKGCEMIANIALLKIQSNTSEAVELYKLACENNNAEACGLLSDIYYQGLNKVKKNKKLALKLLKKSSKLGYQNSSLLLAQKYISGKEDVVKNTKLGVKMLSKLCDANQNRACITLSTIKYNGVYGIKKDKKDALKLLTNACKNKNLNSGEACFKKALLLADIAKNSKKRNLNKKEKEISEYLKAACEQGYKKACEYSKIKIKG